MQQMMTKHFVIQLNNINDEEPVFGLPIYDAEVLENSPAGTPIINVTAVDSDKGMFGVVTYSLAGLSLSALFQYSHDFFISCIKYTCLHVQICVHCVCFVYLSSCLALLFTAAQVRHCYSWSLNIL